MKKTIITLGLSILVGISAFTVYNYNKSQENNTTIQKQASINTNSTSGQKNANTSDNLQNTIKNVKIKASDFKLKNLNGKEVSLSDYKGKKVFLNFFATWCPPCKAEMPELEKLYQETKDSDLVILAVDLGEDKANVEKFMTNNKYNFSSLLDTDNAVAEKYQVVSIPTSFFIDKQGNIVDKHIGSMTIDAMKKYVDSIK